MDANQLLSHVTHLDNLPSILSSAGLYADSVVRDTGLVHTRIGHEHIKQRRLARKVNIAAGGFLGDYVPFNFCVRSVMLYVLHSGSVDGYDGGQDEVLHLVTSIGKAVTVGALWAFTDRHAELGYARYFDNLADLREVKWEVMPRRQWGGFGNEEVKEMRQAEFLVHRFFPFTAIEQIGVSSSTIANRANRLVRASDYEPDVLIKPAWYY